MPAYKTLLKVKLTLLGRQFIRNSRVVSIQEFLTCLRNIIVLAHKSTHYRPSIKQASAFHIAPANWLRILKFNYYVRHSKLPQSAHFPHLEVLIAWMAGKLVLSHPNHMEALPWATAAPRSVSVQLN